jgi:DNA polymerase-4
MPHYGGSATYMAKAIKQKIVQETGLTASAGVAINKFLAKVASDWHKPDGLFVILPTEIANFLKKLPVEKIPGVGKVTKQKLQHLGISNCSELQTVPLNLLLQQFGQFGQQLYLLSRGQDERPVTVARLRKL